MLTDLHYVVCLFVIFLECILFVQVPLFLERIEEIMLALDQKLTWREWKYLFKLGTSKVVRNNP